MLRDSNFMFKTGFLSNRSPTSPTGIFKNEIFHTLLFFQFPNSTRTFPLPQTRKFVALISVSRRFFTLVSPFCLLFAAGTRARLIVKHDTALSGNVYSLESSAALSKKLAQILQQSRKHKKKHSKLFPAQECSIFTLRNP